MVIESTLMPKARKILSIKPSSFLCFPRELRDLIYRFTLVSLPLWERRHKRTCCFHEPLASCEIPVYLTNLEELQRRGWWDDRSYWDYQKRNEMKESCRRDCWHRRCLALLSTCRQVYEEAAPIFWSRNVFCYPELHQLEHELVYVIPQSAMQKIQRLSLVETRTTADPRQRFDPPQAGSADLFAMLLDLPNLTELELPPDVFDMSAKDVLRLSKLSQLRTRTIIQIPSGHSISDLVYLSMTCDIELPTPKCACRDRDSAEQFLGAWANPDVCIMCKLHWAVLLVILYQWRNSLDLGVRTSGIEQCLRAAKRLKQGQSIPVHRDGAPDTIRLRLIDGSKQSVQAIGLPVNSVAERGRLIEQRRREMLRETVDLGTRAYQVRSQEPATVELGDIELIRHETKRTRQNGIYHAQRTADAAAHTVALLADRTQKLDLLAKHDAVVQTSAAKNARKARRKAEQVLQSERRAARKRVS